MISTSRGEISDARRDFEARTRELIGAPAGAGRTLPVGHGVFNLVAGIWPVIHIRSFERVTGEKVDDWLVKTVGLLLAVIGSVEIASSREDEVASELEALGIGTAAALLAIDLRYALRRRISAVYLLDGLAQAAWIVGWASRRRRRHTLGLA